MATRQNLWRLANKKKPQHQIDTGAQASLAALYPYYASAISVYSSGFKTR
jgi:hypothetical protein